MIRSPLKQLTKGQKFKEEIESLIEQFEIVFKRVNKFFL